MKLSEDSKNPSDSTLRQCLKTSPYSIYTSNIPELATIPKDTAILAMGKDHEEGARRLQISFPIINDWTKRWRYKLCETK